MAKSKEELLEMFSNMDLSEQEVDGMLLAYIIKLTGLVINQNNLNKQPLNVEVRDQLKLCEDLIQQSIGLIDTVITTCALIKFEQKYNLNLLEKNQDGQIDSVAIVTKLNEIAKEALRKVELSMDDMNKE